MLDRIIRNQFDALTEFSIISITDTRGVIKEVNDKFCEISGYSREELVGSRHSIINSKHHTAAFFKDLWRTIAGGDIWYGEIKNRTKNGGFYWVNTTIIPIHNKKGVIEEYFSMRIDITSRKQVEEHLLEQNKTLKEYAHITSHNLRRPICNIMSVLEFVSQGGDLQESLAVIQEYTNELDTITRLLSDIATQSRNQVNFQRERDQLRQIERVMLVDDDDIQLKVNKHLLLKYNGALEIITFDDSMEAIRYLEDTDNAVPELLLLDLNMPRLNGFQFLQRMKLQPGALDVHILTSSINPDDVERAQRFASVHSFMQKPLNPEKIKTLLEA